MGFFPDDEQSVTEIRRSEGCRRDLDADNFVLGVAEEKDRLLAERQGIARGRALHAAIKISQQFCCRINSSL